MSLSKALSDSRTSINTSLRALQALSSGSSSSNLPPLLPGLAESFAQLLSQLHHNVTSLSLSFKPPITHTAALATLEKVNDSFGRIAACVVAASGGQTGSTLADEWKDGTEIIGQEILRLLDVFVDAAAKDQEEKGSRASGSKEENPYLIHTGLVWDAIDRLSKDLSGTEVKAVEKRWRAQADVMKDAWTEFKEFLEDQQDHAHSETEDDEDGGIDFDEDDEFGDLEDMMKGGKMTPGERARAEAARSLFGLYQILQATIPRYLPLMELEPEENYQSLLEASGQLTAAFDTAISAMYPTQDTDETDNSMADLQIKAAKIVAALGERLDRSSSGDEAKREACRAFLGKWTDRVDKESQEWKEKGLSVASLGHALPA